MDRLFILAFTLLIAVSFCYCGKHICKRPKPPENAKMRYKKLGPGNSLRAGSRILFRCKKGFLLLGPKRIKCRRDGNWSADTPVCADARIKCPHPEPIGNGSVTVNSNRRVWSLARYHCQKDYELVGSKRRRCLPSAKWSGQVPKCIKKRCKSPRFLSRFKNGRKSVDKADFEVWSTITFDCNDGYYLRGADSMTCVSDKTWRPSRVPRCYRINCGNPGTPANGRRFGSNFTLGASVKFYCDYGYQLTGSKERTCQSDFQWSGEPAVCDNRKYDCVNPGVPANGRRVGDRFNIGDTVRYYCLSKYSFYGSAVRKCKLVSRNVTNGKEVVTAIWTGEPPVCEDDNKISIPPVNKTATNFQNNFIDKLTPITCSSNDNGKCNYPKSRGRSISFLHPNGLDLVFVFDSSSSIGEENFKLGLEFACRLIEQLGVDYEVGGTRVAAVTFSTRAYVMYNLGDENVNTVRKACAETRAIPYIGGGTGTRFSLTVVKNQIKPLFREGSNRALVLIADGKSNFGGDPETTARVLKEKHNVEIFAIAVGRKVYKREMILMASKGDGHYFHLKSYDDFTAMSEKIINRDYSACGEGGVRSRGRILGGETADSTNGTQWPWQVAIYRDHDFVCGGSLIRDNVVLTAAHCLKNNAKNRLLGTPNSYRVVVGELKVSRTKGKYAKSKRDRGKWLESKGREIKAIFPHQSYKLSSFEHDIALFQLKEPVEWSSTVRPVCLPSASQYVENGLHGYVSGWGYTSKGKAKPESLNYVFLGIKSNKTCDLDSKKEKLFFCAGEADGKKDSCEGDSGGPFVVNFPDNVEETKFSFKVVGIVSYGPPCGKTGEYGFYTRVGHYVNWINEEISKMK